MAVAKPALLDRFRAALRGARIAVQFTPHLALLLLLLAIVLHSLGRAELAETLGDATFFVLVLAVIFRREPAAAEFP